MFSFIKNFLDLIENQNLHWFFIFFLFIIIRWAIVFFHSLKYRRFDAPEGAKRLFSSVIIPVVDEPIDVFTKVLDEITNQHPDEIIVVINGPENPALSKLCADFASSMQGGTVFKTLYTPVAGKRNAIRLGLESCNEQSDICLLVDSDTIWTENTLTELLKPFLADERIGGATTRQKIYQPNRNFVTMVANLLEEIRAEGTMKAMSSREQVGCLPGRTIAFRTEILREVIDEFMTETFMGIHKEVSDDRSLTNLTLKLGYKTVMQDSSVVYTDAPLTWKKFIRQQLRWAEGSQYNNLKMFGWMSKNARLSGFIYWTDMLMPFILVATYLNMILGSIFNFSASNVPYLTTVDAWYVVLPMMYLGCIISFGTRQIKVFKKQPFYYILLIPFFLLFLSLVMTPIRIIGLCRCADGMGWGTRELGENTHSAKSGNKKYRALMRVGVILGILFFCALSVCIEIFL